MREPIARQTDTVGYVRVSTEDQAAERKTSLQDQGAAIAQLAEKLGRTLPAAAVFSDPGASGGTAEGRPGFMALVRYCEQHPRPAAAAGVVLVLNDSRWGRFLDHEDATYWRQHLAHQGWRVRFVENETDDVATRGILRTVHQIQASAYRANLSANCKRGARGAAAKGLWQNEAPIGMRRCASRPGQPGRVLEAGQRAADDEETRLVLGPPAEQAVIRHAFARYAGGAVSAGALVRELAAMWGAKRWSRPVLIALLKNPAYAGDVVWCRRPSDFDGGRQHSATAPESWVVVRDAHPALVSRAVFAEAQARMQTNRTQARAAAGSYLLSGLMACAHCDSAYVGAGGSPAGPPEDPQRYRYYMDKGALAHVNGREVRGVRCPGPAGMIRKRWIEETVIREIAAVVRRPDVQTRIGAELDRQLEARARTAGPRQHDLEQERRRLEAERERLIAAVGRGLLDDREAAPSLARIRTQLETATAALERQRFEGRRHLVAAGERERLMALATDFEAAAARLQGAQLRDLIRPWLASMVIDKRKRVVRMAIRCVPAVPAFASDTLAGAKASNAKTVRRTIAFPQPASPNRKTA